MENPQPQSQQVPPQPIRPSIHPEIPQLLGRMQSGASWFFWIAALSIVNSFATGVQFVVGLGITQIIDGLAQSEGGIGAVGGLVLDVFVAGIFALFGVFARKGNTACFVLGMFIYFLDGLIFAYYQVWISVAFHGLALYFIFTGFTAQRKLVQIAKTLPQAA